MKTNMMVENVKMKNKTLMSLMLILMFMMMLILMPSRVRAVTKYSHTSNISDAGVQNGDYAPNLATKDVVTIPGASSLKVTVTYGTESNYDMLYIFQGEYTGSVTKNMSAGQLYTLQGGNSSTTTVEYEIQGDTVTFAFYSDSNVSYYGYYATIENIAFYTIGSNRYKTLKEAIDSVASGGTATIVVNEDTMDSSNAVIPSGKTITLNTNGKTIIKNDYSITNNGNLTITGGGKILIDAVYTVTLNNNGGTGGTLSVVATLNNDMPNIALPTRAGTGTPGFHGDISSIGNEVTYGNGSYTFEGYFDDPTGGTKYYNADGTSARIWDKETNTTLYAHWRLLDESFYVAVKNGSTVKLLTKYMVKPSTLEQSTDITSGVDTLIFADPVYWGNDVTYPYDLTINTPNITESETPILYYAQQYGAKYGVNGTLLTKEEVDRIVGRTPDNTRFNSTNSGVTWPSWLSSPVENQGFWLGSAETPGYGAWYCENKGNVEEVGATAAYKYRCGIRPVIEVPTYEFQTVTVTSGTGANIGDEVRITQYDGSYEDFYVAGFKDGKVHLLTKYMVKPSTNMQSTDIVQDTDTVAFSSTDYWNSSASNYPYDLTTNTASITEADTPALYYAKQYGAKYGVNGTLLTKEEADRIVGRTPDNKYFYPTSSGVTWPSWLTNQFYSDSTYGYFWLGSASRSNYVWSVYHVNSGYDQVDYSWLKYKYGLRPVIEIPVTTFFPSGVPTPTVTLNKNGGSGGSTSVTATFGSSMPSITVPTRTGTGNPEWTGDISSIGNEVSYGNGSYTFEGYYDDPTGGTKYYNADGTSASVWDKETNATLYAHWKSTDESFYVAGFKDGKVRLLTKYMVKPSTLEQSTDIVQNTDTVVFSSTNYWSSSASYYPYDLTTNTASITEADTPALYYAKQYGAKYGVNGTLLTKEEADRIVGRTPDNNTFYSTDSGVTWPSWLTNQFYSDSTYGYFWLGYARGSYYVWGVYSSSGYDGVEDYVYQNSFGLRPVIEIPVTTFFPSGLPTSTVTLNRNGGTGGSASVTATFGSNMPSITVPTRTGTGNPEWTGDISSIGNEVSYGNGTYAFEGYFDDPTGGTKYYNADGTSASAWDKGTNATLYAHWRLADESFYVAGFKNGKVQLLTKYLVKPSTLAQSTDIVDGRDTVTLSAAADLCSQYGAKYGVTGELLVEEELEAIVGRTPDDDYFYSNDKGINWQDWLDSPFYSGLNTGSYWLNRETGSGKDEWRVTSELNYTEVIYKRTILCGYSSSYRNANIFVQLVSEVPTGTEQFRQKDF